LQPREIDIGELVHNMTDMMRRTLGESIHIETAIQAGLAKVAADPGQLENALLNLALNARDAMPRGGELTIKAATTLADALPGEDRSDMAPGEYVMLAVSDNGSGMPPEVLKRVFEPFFTTKTTGKGSGLGLATVYGFVKQSGGYVRIYSEISRGTTVQLYLPQAKSNNEALMKEYASNHAPRAEGETVLLVEDNEGVRELAAAFLQDLGYAVFEAADAQQALAILEEGRPIDLLFTDLVMPGGMNGLELSREALRRRPTMKVLHTSGYMENALAHDGQFDVGIQLITKPYTKEALAQRIRLVLEQ
jgi:CheY-like chemotaxis protein